MKADPKLEILDGEHPIELAVLVVDNKTLTPEEEEACAVLVACHRAGLKFEMLPNPSYYEIGVKWFAGTPLAAWRAYREEVGDG